MKVKMILPALTEVKSPFFRPIKYALFPPLGLATLAAYLAYFVPWNMLALREVLGMHGHRLPPALREAEGTILDVSEDRSQADASDAEADPAAVEANFPLRQTLTGLVLAVLLLEWLVWLRGGRRRAPPRV